MKTVPIIPISILLCGYLVRSGLNDIFHWHAQSCIFNRSLLSAVAEFFTEFTILVKIIVDKIYFQYVQCFA